MVALRMLTLSSILLMPTFAMADCDYCVTCQGLRPHTCTHSGTFAICGELARIQCAASEGMSCSATYGKCPGKANMSEALTVTSAPTGMDIHIPKDKVSEFLSELAKYKSNNSPQ